MFDNIRQKQSTLANPWKILRRTIEAKGYNFLEDKHFFIRFFTDIYFRFNLYLIYNLTNMKLLTHSQVAAMLLASSDAPGHLHRQDIEGSYIF